MTWGKPDHDLDPGLGSRHPENAFMSSPLSVFFLKFIYLLGGWGGERKKEDPKQAPHCQHRARHGAEPDMGFEPMNGTVRS